MLGVTFVVMAITQRKENSETDIFDCGSLWHGKNGGTQECFVHSLRIKDSALRTSATLMSMMAEVNARSSPSS